MEDKKIPQPHKPIINLKQVPPLDPHSAACHTEKHRDSKRMKDSTKMSVEHVEAEAFLMMKDTADTITQTTHMEDKYVHMAQAHNYVDQLQKLHVQTGAPERGFAKSTVNEICVKNSWKPPIFECINEEGPSHLKMFTFKVIVNMKPCTILECYGKPSSRKKIAAESAAEGALWYLGRTGYYIKKR